MTYDKKLPPVRHLLCLAQDTDFPASRIDIELNARRWAYSQDMVEFLRLFPSDDVFNTQADFLTRCEELEILINQERYMPKEILRSP